MKEMNPISLKIYYLILSDIFLLASCKKSDTPVTKQILPEPTTGYLEKEIFHDNKYRDYILYVPKDLDTTQSTPLVMMFHRWGSTMQSEYTLTKLNEIADTAHFILAVPQGINNNWNLSGHAAGGNEDDIGFINKIIDNTSNQYKINENRIYATGMSQGGFFCMELACKLSQKIAAIAPVGGVMASTTQDNCVPTRPVSILQMHAANDNIVNYSGVSPDLKYWIEFNKVDTIPIISNIPNTNLLDESTVQHYIYNNGNQQSTIEHLKINGSGGGHHWFGPEGNKDINSGAEAWKFFSKHDLNGKLE